MGVFTRTSREPVPDGLERAVALPLNAPRALTAAAVRVKMNDKGELEAIRKRKNNSSWQGEAWAYYDEIGEIKYAFLLEAAIMSRMKLYVAIDTKQSDPVSAIDEVPEDTVPSDVAEMAKKHFDRLESGHGGISGLLRNASLNLSVPGECYLVQELGSIDGKIPEKWTIRSVDEVEVDNSGKVSLRFSRSLGQQGLRLLESSAFVGRIWRPHPRYFDEADSSMRALLLLCEELLLLNRAVRATAKSRLNAGALFIPDGLSVAAAPDIINEDGSYEEDADAFEKELIAAMTTPIADEDSASAVVPMMIRGPGELGSQIKQFKFERSFDAALAERADRVLERILQGLDVPKDVVTGLASVKYSNAIVINESMYRCVDESTEILTQHRGWTTHDDLQIGDVVLTLNHDTGLSEWQPVTDINRRQVENEPMLSMESRHHSSLTTFNHRWPVFAGTSRATAPRKWRTSETLRSGDRIITSAPCADLPTEAKYSDDFVALVGWFWTEGQCRYRSDRNVPQVSLSQSNSANPDHVIRIRQLLTRLYGPATDGSLQIGSRKGRETDPVPRWREYLWRDTVRFRLNWAAAEPLVDVAPDRIVTSDFIHSLTEAQLHLFLDASVSGDGHTRENGSRRITQKGTERLAAAELAVVLLGWTPLLRSTGEGDMWSLTLEEGRQRGGAVVASRAKPTRVLWNGIVWCPTTENHSWFARRNGTTYFTGNSHIEPLTLLLCDALTVMYMRPALIAKGVDPELVDRISIWYDPSGILTSADRASSANEGWDRFLIGGNAWRSAHGFSDTDAPTGEELVRRIAVQRGQVTAELTEAIYQQIAPDLLGAVRQANIEGAKTPMPESLQQLLETGQLPEPAEGEEPLPPEILEGLPLPMSSETSPEEMPAEEVSTEEPPPEEEPLQALGLRRIR